MKTVPLALLLAALAAGCSSPPPPPTDGGSTGFDAGPPPDTTVAPQVQAGSFIVANPNIVTVTWSNDDPTFVTDIQGFASKVAASSIPGGYWTTTTSEYGVGALTATNYAVGSSAAASIDDAQIQAFVKGLTPPSTGTPFFFLYYPATTAITGASGGVLCADGVGGYHETLDLVGGGQAVVAVIPRCSDPTGQISNLDLATITASHELVEGVADPKGSGGYVGLSPAYIAFAAYAAPGAEIGDMCEYRYDAAYNPPDISPYFIQRTWSNASAAAGHDPCVPIPSTNNWFITSSAEPDYFEFYWGGGNGSVSGSDYGYAWGIRVPFNGNVTVPLHLLGDSTAPATWDVTVYDTTEGKLTYSLDKSTGSVGDTVNLTITCNVSQLANSDGAFVLDLHSLYTPDGGTAAQQEVRQWFTFVQPYSP
jgi:hypothetical protein